MDIGFIGLGNMGAHMARRLIEAGHRVVVFDTRQEAIGNLAVLGAVAARSPAEVADAADTVMASLPTPDVVLKVATGPNGVIEGKRVRRFVDLSTTGATMAQRIFTLLAARNIVQIDSPVSGGVVGAEKGALAVMASGPLAEIAAIEPALAVFGKIFILGERPGAGQTMKLVNNALAASATAATAEVMVTGVKAGLDPRLMLDVINAGTGRNTATEIRIPQIRSTGQLRFRFYRRAVAERREPLSRRARKAWRADAGDRGDRSAACAYLRRTRTDGRQYCGGAANRKTCRC